MVGFRVISVLLLSICAACASTSTTMVQEPDRSARLPFPEQVLVYDFAVTPGEIPADDAAVDTLAVAVSDPGTNPERLALEHEIAGILAQDLVDKLRDLGLPARRWSGPPPVMNHGIAIQGQFLTIDQGSSVGRMIIGFGVGGTEVKVLVQGYHITPTSKVLLSAVEISAESSKKPGIAATLPVGAAISGVGAAAAISTGVGVVTEMNQDIRNGARDTAAAIVSLMERRMREQGWIL